MKRFLKNIVLFILPLIAISYPLDVIVSNSIQQNSHDYLGEIEVWNDIYKSNINVEVAIYGSSRAWVHFDTNILETTLNKTVYNFGIDGYTFPLQYLRHKVFINNNPKPKTIILAVDTRSLKKRNGLYQKEQFLPFMLWNKNIKTYTQEYEGFNVFDYYLPYFRYRNHTTLIRENLFANTKTKKYRYKGYRGFDKAWDYNNEKKLLSDGTKHKVVQNEEVIQLFKNFIKECHEDKVKLIFVYAPEQILGQNRIANKAEIINSIKEIADNNNIKFYDYSESYICKDKSLFYNAMHLNKKGAEIFTKDLANKLKINGDLD